MPIELTVAYCDAEQDVAIDAPESAPFATLSPELARTVAAPSNAALWNGDGPLSPTSTIGDARLRTGSMLRFGPGRAPEGRRAVLTLQVVGGPSAGLVLPLERGQLTIGRTDDCDVVLADSNVSRRHAVLDVAPTSITIRDLSSTNGTEVDGVRVTGDGIALSVGALISMGDSLLSVDGPIDVPAQLQPGSDGTLHMLRPPRHPHVVPQREIVLPTRATTARPHPVQWLAAALPAAAGGALAWFAKSPQFLLFALLTPVMLLSTALGDRVHWRRSRRRAAVTYQRRCAAADREIAEALAAEAAVRRAAAPDPATVRRQVALPGSRVWERSRSDPDSLQVRLGTADLESALTIRADSKVRAAGTVRAVPVCIDLRGGPLGIAGPHDVVVRIGRWLVGQLAALHSPDDLEVALLLETSRTDGWRWARWLPQLRGRVAAGPDQWRTVVDGLAATVEQRLANRPGDRAAWQGAWIVLVIDRASAMADVPGLASLLAKGAATGLTALCLDDALAALPAACVAVARVHAMGGTRLTLRRASGHETETVVDQVTHDWAEEVARGLAPLVDVGTDATSTLPERCELLDVLGSDALDAEAIERRWRASRGGADAALGRDAHGVITVDLTRDGPHALVAGTTGSGKSELLQALVVGLAASHPPEELNVLLIDYKGGAAFGDCARLPHSAGLVTDLDAYLTERALRSLHSELRRRERLFAQAGASDLPAYRASPATDRVARLVIVVDEFAALADELPDFVQGLVGVAQRGRSLGMHLVLATQRPGNAVSPEIRANTGLRIALRVTDPAESSDVIDSPVAAAIARSCPGRAYLRAGSTLTCFQTAHGSATSDSAASRPAVVPLGPWREFPPTAGGDPGETTLARTVEALRSAADAFGHPPARRPWLAALPDQVPSTALDNAGGATGSVALGLVDLPDDQSQPTLTFDVAAAASLLIVGAPGSGRTQALAALAIGAASQVGPSALQVYVIDAGGGLSTSIRRLPHCATVLGPDELPLVPRLLHRLRDERTRVGDDAPAVRARRLLLIDGWDAVSARLSDRDAALCTDVVSDLLRDGTSSGLSTAVTGGRALLAPRFAGGFADRILLRLSDRADYGLAGVHPRHVPTAMPAGRGVRASDGAIVQLAHVGNTPDQVELGRCVDEVTRMWAGTSERLTSGAIRIRPLPARIRLADLPTGADGLVIGVGGDDLEAVVIDPFAGSARLLVAGRPRSGRSTLLQLLLRQAHRASVAVLVAAPARSPLAGQARQHGVLVLEPGGEAELPTPHDRMLVLMDDQEAFHDTRVEDRITGWLRNANPRIAVVVAGRTDDLATTYRGLAAEVRRSRCGILLGPSPVDGELLGVRVPRESGAGPPGRGVVVGEPGWGTLFVAGEPVPVQVATL